jgi:hypothetical protein
MITLLVSLLAMAPAAPLHRAMPFAKGPLAGQPVMTAAIAKCQAPATIVQSDGAAIVLLAEDRSESAFNCLSAWIATHSASGFEKFGFVGREAR